MNGLLGGILKQVGGKLVKDITDHIPDTVRIKLDPVKDYLLENKKPKSIGDFVEVTGKAYRKEVMTFNDPNKNYHQY